MTRRNMGSWDRSGARPVDEGDMSFEAFMEFSGRMCRDICLGRWNADLDDEDADRGRQVNLSSRGRAEAEVNKNGDGVGVASSSSEDKTVNTTFPMIPEKTEIMKLFECPVCYETVLPPIILCKGGHSLCSWCRKNLQTQRCPVCRGNFTGIRNRLAEEFIDMCKVKCRFSEVGCSVVLNGVGLAVHQEEICNFRPILCFLCEKEVSYQGFLEHLETEDKLVSYQANKFFTSFHIGDWGCLPILTDSWVPLWIKSFGQDFFCFLNKEWDNSVWWLWVGMYPDLCEDFLYSIAIIDGNKKIPMKFTFRSTEKKQMHLKVNSIRDKPNQVLESGRCISFRDSELTTLIVHGKVNVAVEIHKITKKSPQDDGTGFISHQNPFVVVNQVNGPVGLPDIERAEE